MSNRSTRRQNKNTNKKNVEIPNSLSYGTVIGLIVGLIIGSVIFFFTDNMFWLALSPIICLFIGLGIGSYFPNTKKSLKKHS